ncbi:MAG: TaqI-like C-terminal specificity domain-containing protein [Melioribacteraceae bacterium]
MNKQDSAFALISLLINDFKINESKFLSYEYSEADVRKDFIDKFFLALGWDMYHNEQKNPYEQEVKIERGMFIGRVQKRADYAFYIAPNYRDVKFYLEAKKPSRNLFNADDYFQACRYGWNSQTEITFLFDFEELHILDCRIKPDISTILYSKIKSYHYTEYLNPDTFAEIYWLLSREAVADNSLSKFAENLPKPKGKSVQKGLFKGSYQSIDEAFLIELDEIRDSLAKSFKKSNPFLASEQLTEMTQRTIDRLVFIRFLEDKQIEPEHYISAFGDSKNSWKDFKSASRKLDAKYNGVVFKRHLLDSDEFNEPNDKTFSSICEELAHVNSPYNFDIIPIHILGSIYERFLGKVVIATDKRVRIEEKPEVRKAGGVYYTPQYIVNYIVDNTVGKQIEGKTPIEIAKLSFADISCGSGSFLITVFDRLLEYHRKWYQENETQAKKDGCYFQDGKWILSLKQKQKILTNNIYGVDLDSQAVEVTQLSLYLKLLEDETTATAQDTWVMFKEQLLPNLKNNIICGNSLIGTDILEGGLFKREDELKLKPMNFEDAFPDIMKSGGFDAIVGNPPYLYSAGKDYKEYYLTHFTFNQYQTDYYVYFIEKSLQFIKPNGMFSYIVSDSWLNSNYFRIVRETLLSKHCINKIAVFDYPVFKKVALENSIFIINVNSEPKNIEIIRFANPQLYSTTNYIEPNEALDVGLLNPRKSKDADRIFKLIEINSSPLINFIKINRGLHAYRTDGYGLSKYETGYQTKKDKELQSYHSNEKLDKSFLPEIKGKDIDRYIYNYSRKYISYGKWLAEPRTPDFFYNSKIVLRKIIGTKIHGTFIKEPIAIDQSLYIIINKDSENENLLKILLGILCSSLGAWYIKNKYSIFDTLYPWYTIKQLSAFPIKFSDENSTKLLETVNQLLEAKKNILNPKTDSEKEYLERKCSSLDRQIDNLVYELYGLTEDEIKIIESAN